MSYCTLQQARTQLATDTTGAPAVAQDPILFDIIDDASRALDDFTGRWFAPRYMTLGFSGETGIRNPLILLKDYPLVQLDALLNGDGTTIASTNYALLPYSQYPKEMVRLNEGNYFSGPSASVNGVCYGDYSDYVYAIDAIRLTGIWVYHRQYLRAWRLSNIAVNESLSATDTEITVTPSVGTQFDVGNLLRIDNEFMRVIGPIASSTPSGFGTTTITVERDYDNYTDTSRAAAHTSGTAIYVWQPETIIQRACAMTVAAFYKQRDNATGDQQLVQGFGAASMIIPQDIPGRVKTLLRSPYWSHWRGRIEAKA